MAFMNLFVMQLAKPVRAKVTRCKQHYYSYLTRSPPINHNRSRQAESIIYCMSSGISLDAIILYYLWLYNAISYQNLASVVVH